MATILKRKGPKGTIAWQAQVRRDGYPPQIKTFSRKGDADRWAKRKETEMDQGTWRDAKEASKLTLEQALERYLKYITPKKKPKTQTSEKLSAKRLTEAMGKLSLLQVTPEKVASYRDKRLDSVSANTVRIELALLSNLFNIAAKEWSFSNLDNSVQKIKKPQIGEGRCPTLSSDEISRLVEGCHKSRSEYLYPFVVLALHTGCRSGELRGLRWQQVALKEGFVSLVGSETKTGRSRLIPLTKTAQKILLKLRPSSFKASQLVFPSAKDPSIPRDMHIAFDRVVKRVGLGDIPGFGKLRIHDLRHLCATTLLMEGVDIETVRDILGHTSLTTTQKYLHVVEGHKRKAIDKLDNLGKTPTKK